MISADYTPSLSGGKDYIYLSPKVLGLCLYPLSFIYVITSEHPLPSQSLLTFFMILPPIAGMEMHNFPFVELFQFCCKIYQFSLH